MNNESYDNNNNVIIKGKINKLPAYSHTVMGEGFFEMFIEVDRLSNETDILPVTISERLISDFQIGQELGIIGQFRSYNKLGDGKSRLMLTVFVKELINPDEINEINQIFLIGYICKEPIYRTTPFGREICDVLMAVNRAYNKSDYLPCIAWGRNARFVRDLGVGEKLELQGRLQSRKYQKKHEDGTIEDKVAYEISISSVMIAREPVYDSFDDGNKLEEFISAKNISTEGAV